MLRSQAVQRITDGLGFRTNLADRAILRLQEAQRDLERGKTLPRFLINHSFSISTVAGQTAGYALPDRFIRLVDSRDSPVFYFANASATLPIFMKQATEAEALTEFSSRSDRAAPTTFILTPEAGLVFLLPPPDAVYTVVLTAYCGAELLTSDIENAWLEETQGAPEWLIGEAGRRLAADLRDGNAVALFDEMRTQGRAACLAEIFAADDAYGPRVMGEDF